MEITRDALMRVVKAARAALSLAETLSKSMDSILNRRGTTTVADDIAGNLADALFQLSGEKLEPKQDFFNDSQVMGLLMGPRSDDYVTREIEEMHDEATKAPVPQTISAEHIREMFKKNGGYMRMPEDDRK